MYTPPDQTTGSCKSKKICLLQTQRLEGERGFVNKVSWAICWHRIQMKVTSRNEEVKEICDNNEIMRLKWMKSDLECRSKRVCIHVGFYVIQYIRSCEVRWWTSPPQMDLSPCARVYIQGGRWVSNWSGFWLVWSGTVLQLLIKRSLDLFWLMWWISYSGLRYDIVAHQPSAWICRN